MPTYNYASSSKYAVLADWQTIAVEDLNKSGYINLGQAHDDYSLVTQLNTTIYINAQGGNDRILLSGFGNSVVHGGTGSDYLSGGSGADTLYGGSGSDMLLGGNGYDQLFGGADNDTLYGGAGSDVLNGGTGNDSLSGGFGSDDLTGGMGADTFHFGRGDSAVDYINDFQKGEDKINIVSDYFFGLQWGKGFNWFSAGNVWVEQKEDGQHVYVDYKDSALSDFEIIVQTTDGALLTADDFQM